MKAEIKFPTRQISRYCGILEEENKKLKEELEKYKIENNKLRNSLYMKNGEIVGLKHRVQKLEKENKKLKDGYKDSDYIADLKRKKGLGLNVFLKFKGVLDDNKYLPKKAEHGDVYFIAGINKNYFYTILGQWKDLEDYTPGD